MKKSIPAIRKSKFFPGLLLPLLACLMLFLSGAAAAETARDLTAECTFTFSRGSSRKTEILYDHNYEKTWKSNAARNNYLEVHLPAGETCSGVQIKWAAINKKWCVEVKQDGEWVAVDGYREDQPYLTTWTPLDQVTEFRIASHSGYPHDLQINELTVLSAGDLPDSIQVWEPTYDKADLMVIIAHPDDEYVFLGAVIPYYGAERGKRVLVVYITESSTYRRTELLDGLWTAGQRSYPLTGKFYDRYTMSLEEAYKKLGKNKVRSYVVELFRRYRPDVVVTHDIHGEYGHGVHKVCADAVLNALCASTGALREDVWETDTMSGINYSEVPVTIVEMGYMTNQEEDERLSTPEYQRLLAIGIADGIDAFFGGQNEE